MDQAEEVVKPEDLFTNELQTVLQEVDVGEQIASVCSTNFKENQKVANETSGVCKEAEVNIVATTEAAEEEKGLNSDQHKHPEEASDKEVSNLSEVQAGNDHLNLQDHTDETCQNMDKNEVSTDFVRHECIETPKAVGGNECGKFENVNGSCVVKSEGAKEEAIDVGILSTEYVKYETSIDALQKHLAKEKEELNALHVENQVLKTEIEDLKMSLNEVTQKKQSSMTIQLENDVENTPKDEKQREVEIERATGIVMQESTSIPTDDDALSNEPNSELLNTKCEAITKNTEKKDNLEYCQSDVMETDKKEQVFENEDMKTPNYSAEVPCPIEKLKSSAEQIINQSIEEERKPIENFQKKIADEDSNINEEPEQKEVCSSTICLETTDNPQVPSQDSAIARSNLSEEIVEKECIAQAQGGVEVMSPKGSDKVKHSKHRPEQSTTAEEGTKEAQRPRSRTYPFKVLVSGLPLGARREDVLYYFSQFGEVLKMWDEGRHRANVLFADEESFKKAVFAPDPYFDDHKLLIRSLNETTVVISGIPRCTPLKDAEKAVKAMLEEAGVPSCRLMLPLSDPTNASEQNVLQGHAFVAFSDPQTLQKAEDRQLEEPFMIAGNPVKLHSTPTQFYEQFCIRAFPLPPEQPRSVVYHNVHATFAHLGEIVALSCQYIGNATAYAVYILFDTEEAVKKAKEMEDVKILGQYVEVQEFFPFEQGQGFRHLWLKILNLPSRATITEIKHHFGHDRGILNIELDLDFGSCFMQVDSEAAIQRCLRMHQTYMRGKCIAILIAEDHPDRAYYREVARRGRRGPNFRNNSGRKKAIASNTTTGFNGKTFTSATQPQGNQDRRGFERGDRKFSKSRSNASNPSKESSKAVKDDGDGVKIAETRAA